MANITILEDVYGDWACLYVNGMLEYESHSLPYRAIFDALIGKTISDITYLTVDFGDHGGGYKTIQECCDEGLITDEEFLLEIETARVIALASRPRTLGRWVLTDDEGLC